jgi:glycosyltransferase involved in cell wall biosynthesis
MTFSIVTPSLNQGRYLKECLASVRANAQALAAVSGPDVSAVEHLVVDGGSTDGTIEVLKDWEAGRSKAAASGARFFWTSEADQGQTDAINKGLARANGEILAYLCSDDLYEEGALSRVAQAFTAHPEADVVYGDAYFLEGESGWKRLKRAGPFSRERLGRHNFLIQPAVFWRRRVMDRHGVLDTTLRYCMDHEYWWRIMEGTEWRYVPEPLAAARLHADAKTSRALVAAWWEAYAMAGRYGRGRSYWWRAWAMQAGGQWFYAAKRRFFAALGSWRRGR